MSDPECCVCGRQSDSCSSLYWESDGRIYCASHQGARRYHGSVYHGAKVFSGATDEQIDAAIEKGIDEYKRVLGNPFQEAPAISLIDVVRRKGCTPTAGKTYLAAQQAARGVKLVDYTCPSVWEVVQRDGGYVRDVLERRYRSVHAKGRELMPEELSAISRVAEEPPLEPIDMSGPTKVSPAFEAVEKVFGMDPQARRYEQLTPELPD